MYLIIILSIVNLRTGPSFDHPIKLIYKKKNLPLIIIYKFKTWREIKSRRKIQSNYKLNTQWKQNLIGSLH